MDEEKQLENVQPPAAGISSDTVDDVENKVMSAETNLPTDPETNPLDADQVSASGENVIEPELEPFDLSPEAAASAAESAAEAVEVARLKATIAELTQQAEVLKGQVEGQDVQYKRLAADFENYRKRTQKEKEEQEQVVKCATVKELLPVVDNFERARAQIKPQTDAEMTIHKSYQGVYKQFVDALKKIGVSPMRSEGKEFDPALHEAVMREHTSEAAEGTVLEELMRGYMLGERVLRHAMVKVAAAPEQDASDDAASSS